MNTKTISKFLCVSVSRSFASGNKLFHNLFSLLFCEFGVAVLVASFSILGIIFSSPFFFQVFGASPTGFALSSRSQVDEPSRSDVLASQNSNQIDLVPFCFLVCEVPFQEKNAVPWRDGAMFVAVECSIAFSFPDVVGGAIFPKIGISVVVIHKPILPAKSGGGAKRRQ